LYLLMILSVWTTDNIRIQKEAIMNAEDLKEIGRKIALDPHRLATPYVWGHMHRISIELGLSYNLSVEFCFKNIKAGYWYQLKKGGG